MEKEKWQQFLATKLSSLVSLETSRAAERWALGLVGLFSLGAALGPLRDMGPDYLYASKVLFLILFHLILALGLLLPSLLQKGENAVARSLGVRDFTSVVWILIALVFYAAVVWALSFQTASAAGSMRASGFFSLVSWLNLGIASFYALGSLFCLLSLLFFPDPWAKMVEKGEKFLYVLLALHAVFAFLMTFGYGEIIPIGSPSFFEQLRVVGLFWIFIGASILFVGKLLEESALAALSDLELEVVAGKLERREDILARFKEAFVSRRLSAWVHRLSHSVATRSHEVAELTHEAVSLVSGAKPSETDLIKVEDRYRKAESRFKRLDRENQRFLLCLSLFNLWEAEREKVEVLRDQFSRELRNAKLELASVRKQIDEKLVSLKNRDRQTQAEAPVEKVPVSR